MPILPPGQLERVQAHFAAQFREEATGTVYRRGGKGPAVPVTSQERDAFIRAFDRDMGRLVPALLVSTVVLLGAVEVASGSVPPAAHDWMRGAVLALVMVGALAYWWWIRNAPARALERRTAIGNPLAGEAVRRENMACISWSTIVIAMLLPIAIFVSVALDPHPWRDNIVPIIVGVIGEAAMAAIAIAKARG